MKTYDCPISLYNTPLPGTPQGDTGVNITKYLLWNNKAGIPQQPQKPGSPRKSPKGGLFRKTPALAGRGAIFIPETGRRSELRRENVSAGIKTSGTENKACRNRAVENKFNTADAVLDMFKGSVVTEADQCLKYTWSSCVNPT